MTAIETKIVKARTAIVLEQPFFGALALRLPLVEDKSCKTMWVDGVSMGYNPEYVESLDLEELKGVICHEVLHIAAGHHCRMQGREPKKWNQAADYPINNAIDACDKPKIILPGKALRGHDGLEAEAVYAQLPDPPEDDKGKDKGDKDGDGDQPQDNSSGGTGEVRPYPGPDKGDEDDGQGPSEAELAQQEQDWKVAAQQAAQAAKACGKLPAGLDRLVQDILEPKVNWKEALHMFVAQIEKNDYTFARANRRYLSTGFILPSLYNQVIPPIEVIIDTSCSVSQEELTQFASEIDDILNQHPTTVHVTYCDTKVAGEDTFTPEDRPIRMNAKGGGGTRFAPAFEHISQKFEVPCCAIYLTDMECDDFGPEPDYPVLWVQTCGRKRDDIPFGTLIKMEE